MAENAVQKIEPQEVAEPLSETAALLSMIERVARDPNSDIEKFERLVAVKERMEDKVREAAFNTAMSAAQAEMEPVARDAENNHTRSKYATLEAISEAVRPVYTQHGFSLSFGSEPSPIQGCYRIYCIAAHTAGHSRRYEADLPADVAGSQGKTNKTAIQGFGSTMSYGRRYLTLLIFNVALKDEDDDGQKAGVETITDEQAGELRTSLEELDGRSKKPDLEATAANFCALFNVEKLGDIPATRYAEASMILRQKLGG